MHFTVNLLRSVIFPKNQIFFPENTYILFNKTKFWTFWGVLLFQSHFAAILLLFAILKKFKKFSGEPICFSVKRKPIFKRFEKFSLLIRNLVLIFYLYHFFKILVSFRKSHLCFVKKGPEFSTVLRNPTYSVAFYSKFANFSDFKNTLDIFSKNAAFCQRPKFWTFYEILVIQSHSEANLLPFQFFVKIKFFFEKPIWFFPTEAIFWTFWEVLLFQSHFTTNLLL